MATTRPCFDFGFLNWLCKIWWILTDKRKGGDPCAYLPGRVVDKPDPCIYSQFLLMQLGLPVTWDNPDVAIYLGGIEQYTYDLTVNTTYDVRITVHNSSRDRVADNTAIAVRWVEFGAGSLIRHPITTLHGDVPAWPGTVDVWTQWTTPATHGHYCIEVELSHPKDADPSNNRGWNNTQVKAAHSTVETPIRIYNQWINGPPHSTTSKRQRAVETGERGVPWNLVELSVDSYNFEDRTGKDADPAQMFAPREPAWPARVEPNIFHFTPAETYRDVALIVDAPSTKGLTEPFNINVRQAGTPVGGVTVLVQT